MEQNKDQTGAAVRGEAVARGPLPSMKADPLALVALAVSGALPDAQVGEILSAVFAPKSVSARADDAPSEPSEPQQKTIDCMDAWAASMQMPTYSELQALTEQYDALIRKICFQYAAGGYNSDGFMAPKSADLKLRWIIDEAYKSPSRAADALDSQPTELPPLPESDWTLAGSANNRDAYTADQMREYGRLCASSQPTDGGVRNG